MVTDQDGFDPRQSVTIRQIRVPSASFVFPARELAGCSYSKKALDFFGKGEANEVENHCVRDWLIERDADVANRYRGLLVDRYGEKRGREIKYAEAFELCQYGAQPSAEELRELFPM